ncbi:hypothetical protein [Neisseria perflava]|uniref:hypothetical protein n=1 Tax=Neisseria perflava TaxID=33053 RepID=UPI00209D4123|nr:hypothetical protein [Neisseria perflava]MCP1659343.1 hypothetical protein [Neisseria perflava]MCP1772852.1 hypothetical protein [Neisseria perflava]
MSNLSSQLQTFETGQQRNAAYYAWLRWLVLLCAGFFSVMAGQLLGKNTANLPVVWIKAAFVLNAAGILAGAVVLHGEVYALNRLLKLQADSLADTYRRNSGATPAYHVAPRGAIHKAAEYVCYAALASALVCWVVVVLKLPS